MMQLLVAADLAPTQSNIDLFNNADTKELLGESLLSLWNAADMRIFNLETPITDKTDAIAKWGPNFVAMESAINGIKALNPTLITLANNHILDQGEEGLKSTLDILKQYKIPSVGAGENLSKARIPYIFDRDGLKVGIYACSEYEFSIAAENSPGANPFDPLESLDHIQNLKSQCDFVTVLYHGGKEHYRYPSPYLQRVCRKIASKGADLVVCQHSHCIGCFEKYDKSTIIYGQGNFILDYSGSELGQTSIIIRIHIDEKLNIEYIPIIKAENAIRLAEGDMAKKIVKAFQSRSEEIVEEGFIEKEYLKLADQSIESYLRSFSGNGRWLSRFDRWFLKGILLNRKYQEQEFLALRNYIECEAHRELLLAGLKRKRNEMSRERRKASKK